MQKISKKDARLLASRIADDLFINGQGEAATRLLIELSSGQYGGGWCKAAVIDRITKALAAD